MPFWKQATQSELVATNSRRILLAANGNNEAKASARDDAISVRSYLVPREPCQFRSSASTRSIGAWIKPKSCVTGCHFSISDDISKRPEMLLYRHSVPLRCCKGGYVPPGNIVSSGSKTDST